MSRSRAPFVLVSAEENEHDLQIACVNMLKIVLRPTVQWTSIDHAHSLDRRIGRHGVPIGLLEAKKRQARGIKPGISDLLFWHQSRGYAIELKRDASESLSDDQEEFLRNLILAGIPVKICWSKDLVFRTVEEWGLTRVAVSRLP